MKVKIPTVKLNAAHIEELIKLLNTITTSSIIGAAVGAYRPDSVSPHEEWSMVAVSVICTIYMYALLRKTKEKK